jgi:eukaryotic-like serine/threonine-protein kinase
MAAKRGKDTAALDRRALAIFEEIVDADPADWPSENARRCGDDAALGQRVRTLLDRAAADDGLIYTGGVGALLDDDEGPLPERVGPYRITGLLGRGGMGVVARGERDDGVFEQAVAIKLMRGNLTSAGALSRFLAERRILGRLVAPRIARILDGGSIDGTPWLAMDLIEGQPITDHAAAKALSLDARLGLFGHVCEAVRFVHRAFVIHADIKPSNVLVTDAGEVKLVDFGIARLIEESEDAAGPMTGKTMAALTRKYAAPERLAGAAPSVAGDVYSLGMLLTDLTEGQAADADLQAIIAKATAATPEARYPDTSALIADLEARAGHQPIAARTTPPMERAAKFLRRHRLAAAIGALLLVATGVTSALYVRAEAARAQADQRFYEVRDLARFMLFPHYDRLADTPGTLAARAELAETAGRYLDQLAAMRDAPEDLRLDTARGYRRLASVLGAKGQSNLGRTGEATAAIARAEALLAPLSTTSADAAEERGWAQTVRWSMLADTAESTRVNTEAERQFRAALRMQAGREGAELGLIQVARNNGYMAIWDDRPGEAVTAFTVALTTLRARQWSAEWEQQALGLEYSLLMQLGVATYHLDDIPRSVAWSRQAAALVDAQLAATNSQLWWDRYGEIMNEISGSEMDLPDGDPAALATARRGIAAMEARLAIAYDETIEKRLTSLLGQQSMVQEEMGRNAEATASMARYIAIREERLRRNPRGQQPNRDMAIAYTAAADQHVRMQRPREACAAARNADRVWQTIVDNGWITQRDARLERQRARELIAANCR